MPTPTDLVTDLPADFEVFGQAVDTSMADLKGGSTGQVLSKNSNTDMDFVWVTSDDANAIQNTIVDAKGDLIAASASDVPARLAVGANGETLVADSSTSTGLRYTAGNPIPNPVINSAFQVWQRGTSAAVTAGAYIPDRWYFYRGVAGSTVSRQVTNDTTNLPFIQYCARVQRDSGNTSTSAIQVVNSFETINSIAYAGKTITMSFYARAGANYSATGGALNYRATWGTGTDQNLLSGYTGGTAAINTDATLTTTWQRFTATATIGATATELGVQFIFTPTGTAGANDYYEITGVQIDIGSVALPFRTNGATIQGELAACQRYYYRISNATAYEAFGVGYGVNTTRANVQVKTSVPMRANISAIDFANLALYDVTSTIAVTNVVIDTGTSKDYARLNVTIASGGTQYRFYELLSNGSTSAYLGFSAEL